jgi:hypothetical protein
MSLEIYIAKVVGDVLVHERKKKKTVAGIIPNIKMTST